MSRFRDTDDDEERLPEHFKRIGYDADTQIYTFEDTSTGRIYESAPGNRYGILTPAGEPRDPAEIEAHNAQIRKGNREAVRTMLPFALLAVVFLLLLFRFIYGGSSGSEAEVECGLGGKAIHVQAGDTCWEIAKAYGLEVAGLLALQGNGGVDCDKLQVGQSICVPA
ncbi:uncharacterized protein EI97DRAFT_469368 [Westerdykella ornata]|uniref:LysM domain-containing protein n=1 Tax=Westerdykella ornata TaxID=318751 RepID=A0A6A6JAK2_WESOR|nr:uncharacterized protein EI97DRAFT_469368 [Westerdykella ornata]KAF2273630.1 hypothetical protein EI97DRAFT_469368 [Westerdykella ornata]